MKVTKDRKGSYLPRTQTWQVEDPDGYDYAVADFADGKGAICIAHGDKCVHAEEVRAFMADPKAHAKANA